MQKITETACIRCGTPRVFKRKWVEKLDRGAVMTHVETACPDNACQKLVDQDFALRREKRLAMEQRGRGVRKAA